MQSVCFGLLVPFLGTSLGAACVFFLRTLNETVEKILLGFAAGVMVAASVWSLLLPAIDGAAALGRLAFLPAAGGFAVGFALLLLLDRYLPEPAITGGGGAKTGMMALAITLHNIPEGMAVGAAFAGVLSGNVGGAAAATVVAQRISAVLCGWYIIRNYPALHFTRNAFANGKKFAANMFWAGLSMGLMSAIYNIGSVVLQSSINALGSTYIAAQVAARRFAELFFIPGGALGIAVATYSSQNLGAGHRSRIMKGVTTALGIYFVWWVFVMLFVFFLSDPAVRAITGTNDEVIISNAVLYLKISAPVIPPMAVLVIVRNMLQGIQHTIEPLLASGLELIGKVIFGVWIVPAVGYTAVCFCEPVTWVICFVFILGALYRCRGELKDKE